MSIKQLVKIGLMVTVLFVIKVTIFGKKTYRTVRVGEYRDRDW